MQEQDDPTKTKTKMESLRLACDREISLHRRNMDSFASSFLTSLHSVQAKSLHNLHDQGPSLLPFCAGRNLGLKNVSFPAERLSKMKSRLKEAEDELVGAISVKTRSEAKRMATIESVSAIKSKVEQLERIVREHKARRDQYSAIISRDLSTEENGQEETTGKEEIQEAISWYNKVLGLKIEGGSGVKFAFNNVDVERPDAVYSFTIRHANDTYTLLQCDPPLEATKELLVELNKSNDLYRFVKIMRRKFQEAAGGGGLSPMIAIPQDSAMVSVSAPVPSASTDRWETPRKEAADQLQHTEAHMDKKANLGKASKIPALSPGSASSIRRSSRLTKVKK